MLKKISTDICALFIGCLIVSFVKSGFGIANIHWDTFIFISITFFVYKGVKWLLTKTY